MHPQRDITTLPTFIALDSYAVLAGQRQGASVQLDETYFSGQLQAFEAFDGDTDGSSNSSRGQRSRDLRESRRAYRSIEVDVDALTEDGLWTASTQFRRELQRIPEISYLERQFPGQCFVVPEWLRTEDHLHYGARVYFFQDDDSTTPKDVMQENIDAILSDSFPKFERYQGRLHGYPDCCIDFYHDRSSNAPSPEWRSIEPFADRINEPALGNGLSASIDDMLPQFSGRDDRFAFFAREFFPEPGCETALTQGEVIFDSLSSEYPTALIEDYFRLNFSYNYLIARAVHTGGTHRPVPGELGEEHLMFYLPLRELLTIPRYS
ncbi:hypothetical protein DQW50_06345 [Halorubrum sp. 48-1-W]|uniref:hypothetical protein n=1 Tax=Halorubrum sp. 48-1-W TaxID=2249761 RepID=UPI000DCC7AB3|nr:hypothetical protein [Halorubrum sp. 48-1-W]RAW45830.1 hypothetical protein DQW50_06345 [Halorubrum sp. 48-1-W]